MFCGWYRLGQRIMNSRATTLCRRTLHDSAEENVSVSLAKKGKRRLDMSH